MSIDATSAELQPIGIYLLFNTLACELLRSLSPFEKHCSYSLAFSSPLISLYMHMCLCFFVGVYTQRTF